MRRRIGSGAWASALVIGLVLAGCGSASRTQTGAPPAVTNPSSSAKSPLARYLLMRGEEAGFPPNASATNYTSAANWAAFSQAPGGASRLRSEGFVDAVIESIGTGSTSGSSNVTEFATAAGARSEAADELKALTAQVAGATTAFTVPGVASAKGVVVNSGGTVDTNVFWVQGRCTMILGNSAGRSLRSEVVAGVQAIDRRTHGTCP